jgi:hypothetical protein
MKLYSEKIVGELLSHNLIDDEQKQEFKNYLDSFEVLQNA